MVLSSYISRQALRLPPGVKVSVSSSLRPFSVLNRPRPNYDGHVPLTTTERVALAAGSAVVSLWNPRRGGKSFYFWKPYGKQNDNRNNLDMIAALGEATATPYFIYRLRDAMLSSPTGRRILRDRPRINSKTISLDRLRQLPENSVGRAYAAWLDREGVGPDTRENVRYIDDEECAYVMQRYRECHDFSHALTGLPVIVEGEVAVKAFEFANTLLPMTGLSMAAVLKLKPAERARFWKTYLPWALRNGFKSKELINVYWEEQLERDVDDLRAELRIERPPDLREIRKAEREQRRLAKEKQERLDEHMKNA